MRIRAEKLIYGGFGLGREIKNGSSVRTTGTPFDSARRAPFGTQAKPIFVRKSVPGDVLDVEIVKDKKNYAEGIIKRIIKPSTSRIQAPCPNFETCGGCDHQNISYADQLKFKEEIFRETLGRAGIETEILPITAGSDSEFYYRNTMRFFFLENKGKLSLAMHHYAKPGRLIPIGECHLLSEWSNNFANELLNFLNAEVENKNSFFQLRMREGKFTGEKMVEIITKTGYLPEKQKMIWFLKKFPEIKSAYHTASAKDNLIDAKRSILMGSPVIHEKIGKFTFQISPDSFFQTNSMGIKTLYDKIKEFADAGIGDSVLDLYCGTGTIGIYLSTLAKKVTGVESVQSSINDANANAKMNNVCNTEFICADVADWLSNNITIQQYDNCKIIVDPPREGLSPAAISQILNTNPKSLTYTSCNPSTFARDIKEFEKNGLELKKVQPVDMFPQTQHIECVGLIKRGTRD